MLEIFLAQMQQDCASQIVAETQALDIQAAGNGQTLFRLFQQISGGDAEACAAAYVGVLASSIDRRTPRDVTSAFMAAAIRLPPARRDDLAQTVAEAWTHIRYDEAVAKTYFEFAGLYRLAVPPEVDARYAAAPVSKHTDPAFAHRRYLLLVGDPHVEAEMEAILARASQDVDMLMGLVSGLVDTGLALRREGRDARSVRDLLEPFRQDDRRATGVNGPGSGGSISGLVTPALTILSPR